ncbi:hypothetical protein D3OALGA1CA_4215 [Olavius algarvensis associated proteobacterium Delta 3]|nr:hypothetical protein D3OALGB2SA_4281 [Olavius algarvensis associated proteobacterium Delta 3]CAB5147365.1 hypothetical protein D3OALGA1CA_4215 [Olavius algarvensis associated proteobacterium Delta 3]
MITAETQRALRVKVCRFASYPVILSLPKGSLVVQQY